MTYFVHSDPISKLGLSVRSHNALKKSGISTIAEFMKLDIDFLLTIRNLGVKSIDEINKLQAQSKVIAPKTSDSNLTTQAEIDCMKFVYSLVRILPCHPGELFQVLLPDFINAMKNNTHIGSDSLMMAPFLRKLLKQNMLEVLENQPFGIEIEELTALYADTPLTESTVMQILDELDSSGKVSVSDMVILNRLSLMDYAMQIPNKKHSDMFRMRLEGRTLEEIGEKCGGVTREGVRQIVRKCIVRKEIIVQEDRYKDIFETYAFSKEDFKLAFGISDMCYIYLDLACDKVGELSPKLFLEDTMYPAKVRKQAEDALYRNFFLIDGKRVYKRRTDLADHVCFTYFKDEAVFDDFVVKYNEVVEQLGVHEDPRFIINKATYQNRFSEADNVLWKYQSRFRYYDMEGYDFTALIEGLGLDRYENVEYSTLKFFKSYPELMAEYDVRDEYELHNLLRKIYAKMSSPNVIFSRMPIIEFGVVDRAAQVFKLLQTLVPIDVRGFCDAYEEEYGVLARTVSGGFISGIAKYRDNNGIYNLECDPLPSNQVNRMKELLNKDYYDFSYVLKLYQSEFPDSSESMINSYTLKRIGFKVFSSYLIRDDFANAVEYFRHILTSRDYVDLREFPPSLTSHTSFTSEMYSLKSAFEIVEYEPLKFVNIRKLNEIGITVSDLRSYGNKVHRFVKPNKHFTINLIKRHGFKHPLHNKGYGDWFFASILTVDRKRFSYQRMGGSKIFCKGQVKITMESLFRSIVTANDGIKISEFMRFLREEYGLTIDKYKMSAVIDGSTMYLDRVGERIFMSRANERM